MSSDDQRGQEETEFGNVTFTAEDGSEPVVLRLDSVPTQSGEIEQGQGSTPEIGFWVLDVLEATRIPVGTVGEVVWNVNMDDEIVTIRIPKAIKIRPCNFRIVTFKKPTSNPDGPNKIFKSLMVQKPIARLAFKMIDPHSMLRPACTIWPDWLDTKLLWKSTD